MANFLTIDRTYADNDVLYAADLQNICTSITDFINTTKLNADNLTINITEALSPTGAISLFSSDSLPANWLECDGAVVSQVTYADLYAIVGTTFNTGGEGAGNFRLPNYERRIPVGRGGSGSGTLGNALGNVGGEELVTLDDPSFLPTHAHSDSVGHAHAGWARSASGTPNNDFLSYANNTGTLETLENTGNNTTIVYDFTGGDGDHLNVQPSLVLMFMIRI